MSAILRFMTFTDAWKPNMSLLAHKKAIGISFVVMLAPSVCFKCTKRTKARQPAQQHQYMKTLAALNLVNYLKL